MTAFALQRDRRHLAPDDFPAALAELLAYLEDRMPEDHPFARLAATLPGLPERPEPWLLGSSAQSALWAGELGLPYAFADFISPRSMEITELYRQRFQASGHEGEPRLAVAVWVICADTDEEARRLAASGRMTFTMLRRGTPIAIPPPEEAVRFLEQEASAGESARSERRGVVGSPENVREELPELLAAYGADELIAVNIMYEHATRLRSYELLARALGV